MSEKETGFKKHLEEKWLARVPVGFLHHFTSEERNG